MKKRIGMAFAVVAIALTSTVPSQAANESDTYVLGGRIDIEGAFSVGSSSMTFTPAFAPTKIRVVDDLTVDIGWLICQDGGDGICGQGEGDVLAEGCATGGNQSISGFAANVDTSVFIDIINTGCTEFSTTGTVTISN